MAAAEGGATHESVVDLHKALLAEQNKQQVSQLKRSKSHEPVGGDTSDARAWKAPGGFRREFLHAQAEASGVPMELRPKIWQESLMRSVRPLIRVGYFDSVLGIRLDEDGQNLPLLQGESGTLQTILAVAKSFVGSGVTFLPGAFIQGGWLFSSLFLIVIASCNAYCIWLLLGCSSRTGLQGYGDIAEAAAGRLPRQAVHVSLVISQFGTNIAYMIFISQMAESLGLLGVISKPQLILVIVIVLIPLCFVRSIHRMELVILGADMLIVFGLGAVLWYTTGDLLSVGPAPVLDAVRWDSCGLFIGTAVFTFEGIPFILPIRSSMREPEDFWPLFVKVFAGVVLLFVLFGLAGSVDYGQHVQTVVLLNLPAHDPVAIAVRAAYMMALTLSSPLTFLPAGHITELWIFGVVKEKGSKKWQKNALRTIEVCMLGMVALYGGDYFARFLAFVGAFCCAPIAFIYPAWFHLRLCAQSVKEQAVDCFFVLLGIATLVFVVWQSVAP
eukprot:TRINITY_DN72841_c0_g1_i1.p1 TRINITY_DN72841_c0_g1~~TRINITY_DN72841_c0_g1_i1.p1  ORF type:complete len:499 (+),score=60.36 TRINITY_DN72841_c0_g1_i1:62-1558(+)